MKTRNFAIFFLLLFCTSFSEGFGQSVVQLQKDSLEKFYLESIAFKNKMGKVQVTAGTVAGATSLALVASGIVKKVRYEPVEKNELSPEKYKKNGQGLIVAGTACGIASAFLLRFGIKRIKTFKNDQGEVVSEIGLSRNGTGLEFRF